MSTSCVIREVQLYRPQAVCPFFYSRFEFSLLPFVFLLLGFKFWLSQLPVLPDTDSQGTCLALITSRCHIEGCEVPLPPSSGCSPCSGDCWGKPRSPSPCWGTSQRQHLEQPHACCLLLAPSLSTTKRWKVSPASCSQRQAIRQLVQLFTSCFLSLSLITRLFVD